jgi:hypothetical protein
MTFDSVENEYNKNSSSTPSWKDMAVVFLALVYSGNPAIRNIFPMEPQLVCLAFLFGILLLYRTRRFFTPAFVGIALIFSTILLYQCVDFSFYPFLTIAGFFTRLFIGYATFRLVEDFPKVYIRVMVWIAILSFIFYVPYTLMSLSGINLENQITQLATLLGTDNGFTRPLFVYTFYGEFTPRNLGMFWEPGAFQGYMILALIFLTIIKNNISRKSYWRSLFILSAAVLTTMSTTGYIVLALMPVLHFNWRTKNYKIFISRILIVFMFLPIFIGGTIYAFNNLPFLREKIEKQLSKVNERERTWKQQRVGSLIFDFEYIKQRPLTGWGIHGATRYSLHPELWELGELGGMGNGFSDFNAKFGVIGFMTWFISVFLGFRLLYRGNTFFAIYTCCIILLELQGEGFLNYPLFLGLAFLRPYYTRELYASQSIEVSDSRTQLNMA